MRKLAIALVAVVAVAAGCGSDSNSTTALTGTLGGASWTPSKISSVNATAAPCTLDAPGLGTIQLSASAVALGFTTYDGFCTDLTDATCPRHADSKNVTVLVANVQYASGGTVAGTITPQTLTLSSLSEIGNAVGVGTKAYGFALASGAAPTCAGQPDPASGTITLKTVSTTEVTGSVNLTFASGGTLKGDFTAPGCGLNTQAVCTAITAMTQCLNSSSPTCH